MGAIIGDFTRAGTFGIYGFAAIAGMALGLAYTAARTLLPSRVRLRVVVFTLGTTAFMVGQITRANRDDFSFLPVTFSLLLVVVSVALTAAPGAAPRRAASLRTGSARPAGSRAGWSRSG